MANRSRILKVAGLSFVGFCAASAAAGKLPAELNPMQIAGFCGAFMGALAGRYRKNKRPAANALPPVSGHGIDSGSDVLPTNVDR